MACLAMMAQHTHVLSSLMRCPSSIAQPVSRARSATRLCHSKLAISKRLKLQSLQQTRERSVATSQ